MEYLVEGIMAVTWQQIVMYAVGILLIWLAIKKEYEPSLLLPMGFGAILVNLPNSGVINQVMSGVGEVNGVVEWLFEVGIEAAEVMPVLLFIGIGAMIDFGPLLSQPVMFLFGAAAQFGIFFAICVASLLGFDQGCGIYRNYRCGRRPHFDSGISGSGFELHWPHCCGCVFLYGSGAHRTALCH